MFENLLIKRSDMADCFSCFFHPLQPLPKYLRYNFKYLRKYSWNSPRRIHRLSLSIKHSFLRVIRMKTVRPLILHIPFAKHQVGGTIFCTGRRFRRDRGWPRGRNKIACPTRTVPLWEIAHVSLVDVFLDTSRCFPLGFTRQRYVKREYARVPNRKRLWRIRVHERDRPVHESRGSSW